MAVDTKHSAYDKFHKLVKRVRDFIEGEEAVQEYIIGMPGQKKLGLVDELAEFRERAYFLPAVGRTVDAFTGMVMSNGAKAEEVPSGYEQYQKDITNDGEPLSRFTSHVVREVISAGRGAVIADYPWREDIDKLTVKQAEDLGLRPYAKFYKSEEVLNWQMETNEGERILKQLRLEEDYEVPGKDEWESEVRKQIRVMDLDPDTGYYRVRIYRKANDNGKSGEWTQWGGDRFPKMGGQYMTYIPAIIFGPSGLDPDIREDPPLIDMVNISKAHLNNSASYEHGLSWLGCPTLVIAGTLPKDDKGKVLPIRIGSAAGIVMAQGGDAKLLQADADSVGGLQQAMENKRRDMAAMGARILIDSGSSNISTETAKLERVGEHSVLSDISNACADGITQIFRMVLQWGGMKEAMAEKVLIRLNTDFVPKGMAPGELTEWIKGVQANVIPLKIFFDRLKDRGEVPETMTEEDYRQELDKDADQFGMGDDLGGGLDEEPGGAGGTGKETQDVKDTPPNE